MTDNERKAAKQSMLSLFRNIYGEEANIHKTEDKAFAKMYKIFSCMDMANSILAYNNFQERDMTADDVVFEEEHKKHNYLEQYISALGRELVVQIVEAQMNDIDYVKRAVHTDDEGLMYNSIVWVR